MKRISSSAVYGKTDTEIKAVSALQMGVSQVCSTRLDVELEVEGCCLHKHLINMLQSLLFLSVILLSSTAVL